MISLIIANQISKDMGLLMRPIRKEQWEYDVKVQKYKDLREIVIALIQGGWQGELQELIDTAKDIDNAIKNA